MINQDQKNQKNAMDKKTQPATDTTSQKAGNRDGNFANRGAQGVDPKTKSDQSRTDVNQKPQTDKQQKDQGSGMNSTAKRT